MQRLILKNKKTDQILAHHLIKATTLPQRIKGLLSYKNFERHKALWIYPCFSIHTFFMSFSIDVIFVDTHLVVKSIYEQIPPWKMIVPAQVSVFSVFEFTGGALKDKTVHQGDQFDVVS